MKSKFLKQAGDWAVLNIIVPAFIFILKVISMTFSYIVINGEGLTPLQNKKIQVIYAYWHRGNFGPVLYYRNTGVASLVSSSLDGEIATRIVNAFGFKTARGSTFRGAAAGLMEIKRMAEQGMDIAINTDGPRGPEKSVGNGTLYLSKLTGLPIVPFGFFCDKKIRLKSWDKTIIIMPFAKCLFKFGEPVTVPPDADDETIEKYRALVYEQLLRLNADCEAYFGAK